MYLCDTDNVIQENIGFNLGAEHFEGHYTLMQNKWKN